MYCVNWVVILVLVLLFILFVVFFFSSRRRHTRCALVTGVQTCALPISAEPSILVAVIGGEVHAFGAGQDARVRLEVAVRGKRQIGRASCRERVCQYV